MNIQGDLKKQPRIELTELTSDTITFILRNADVSLANALRRIMISEVPTLAVELVSVVENTSVLHDEFIAHRLGLIPIDSRRIRDYKYKEDCTCMDRCSRCSVEYKLDVCCQDADSLVVTHLDLISTDPKPNSPKPIPSIEDISDAKEAIPIVKLKRNQKLKFSMLATKGIGRIHAKWIPTSNAVFQLEPQVTIDETVLENVPGNIQEEIAKICPTQVFQYRGDEYTRANLHVADKTACMFCDECVQLAKNEGYPNLIQISHTPDVFKFIVESTGSLPPEQIVELAFEVLETKLSTILAETAKLEGFTVQEAKHAVEQHMKMRQKENIIGSADDHV